MRSRGAQRVRTGPPADAVGSVPHSRGAVAGTALPASLFECQEPMVEAALMDAAARVFLERLGGTIDPAPTPAPAEFAPREKISADAVARCLAELASLADEPAPDLLRGLDHERTWILFDLARYGTGLGRQRATHELRGLVRSMCERRTERPEETEGVLRALAAELGQTLAAGGFPVVFQALLLEIRASLARSTEASP